jgi:hypothetical protein
VGRRRMSIQRADSLEYPLSPLASERLSPSPPRHMAHHQHQHQHQHQQHHHHQHHQPLRSESVPLESPRNEFSVVPPAEFRTDSCPPYLLVSEKSVGARSPPLPHG